MCVSLGFSFDELVDILAQCAGVAGAQASAARSIEPVVEVRDEPALADEACFDCGAYRAFDPVQAGSHGALGRIELEDVEKNRARIEPTRAPEFGADVCDPLH